MRAPGAARPWAAAVRLPGGSHLAAAGLLALLVLGVTACGSALHADPSSDGAAGAAKSAAKSAAASRTGRSAAPTTASSSPSPSAAAASGVSGTTGSLNQSEAAASTPCGSAATRASLVIQPTTGSQPDNRVRALVVVTDVGGTCTLDGFPRLWAARAGGAWSSLALQGVDLPAKPQPVTLQGGASAYAGVEWTTGVGPACSSVRALEVAWPGSGNPTGISVGGAESTPVTPAVCAGGALATPLQSSAASTVAFPDATGSGLPACTPANLHTTTALAPRSGQELTVDVVLTNAAARPCALDGAVGAPGLAGGSPGLVGGAPDVDGDSGAGMQVLAVEPGQAVSFTLSWPHGATRCAPQSSTTATSLRLSLPGGAGAVPVTLPGGRCAIGPLSRSGLEIGAPAA
ncbi:MAG TPA: DUF4232 domain-containing protein [Acidimicrobiales bacterium]|nr:DUF4232 domain-containing protein [Acidimicrobiales bacterium]